MVNMTFIQRYIEKAENEVIANVNLRKQIGHYPFFIEFCSEQGPIVKIAGREVIMLGSNNYLGMTTHPKVKKAAKKAIDKYGVGSTGSRMLNGTMNIHTKLEKRLANFFSTESCVIFPTGMQANLGGISCFLDKNDWVVSDIQNHASIVDGIRLGKTSKEHKLIYKHNDMQDLGRCLKSIPSNERCLIVTDGVFSMEGDLAHLDIITELAEQYGAGVYVDDAHGIGVFGPNGRGTVAHFGVQKKVDLMMGTFSKSFASIGGFIAASEVLCEWMRHRARSFIFSASSPPASVATVLAVLDIIEKDDSYQQKLWKNTKRLKEGYLKAGFNIGMSESPIIPLIIGDPFTTFQFGKLLLEERPRSVFTNPAQFPATLVGRELVRTSAIATLDYNTIDEAVEIITRKGKELEIIH